MSKKATLLDIEIQNASYGKKISIMDISNVFKLAKELVVSGKSEKDAAAIAVDKFAIYEK